MTEQTATALAACSVLAWPLWRAVVAVGRAVLRGGGRRG